MTELSPQLAAMRTLCPRSSACYNAFMAGKASLIILMLCALLTLEAISSPASVGSAFADTYSAFAPLYALYRSYANYLFSGTEVVVPNNLEESCATLTDSLGSLQIEIITQTDSQRIEQITRIAHLRQTTDMFCQSYSQTIVSIASMPEVDLDAIKQAADSGLFVAVSDENKALEGLFSSTLDTYAGSEQWRFAVSFSMRSILKQEDLVRLDSSLREILLGPESAPYAEGIIPADVLVQSRELASLAGVDLDDKNRDQVLQLADEIYSFLMSKEK